ncbi:unnamed protein product [Paramecium primaurelia]|uniref:Uncharacterized protein n=1 Tax=Paramecium primaurelia TaxID=5886 RepID=A0A8S1NGM5_PARPR|nr:unnamed protein product [Paramecium primaurelia]
MLQEQISNQQVEQEIQEYEKKAQMDQDEEQHDKKNDNKHQNICEQENKQIYFNIKISDLTLLLSKDDYF